MWLTKIKRNGWLSLRHWCLERSMIVLFIYVKACSSCPWWAKQRDWTETTKTPAGFLKSPPAQGGYSITAVAAGAPWTVSCLEMGRQASARKDVIYFQSEDDLHVSGYLPTVWFYVSLCIPKTAVVAIYYFIAAKRLYKWGRISYLPSFSWKEAGSR